jgi:drug/metabolite transporter (DMT)-like permease
LLKFLLVKKTFLLELLLLAVVAVWGANFAVVKYSLQEVSPMAFNSLRFMVAIAVMWYLVIHRGSKVQLHKKDIWPLVGLGLLGNFVYQVAFIIGIQWSYAANAAVLLGSGPMYVALISHFVFKNRVSGGQILGIVTGFMGVLILILGKDGFELNGLSGLGDLLLFVAALCWALTSVLSVSYLNRYSALDLAVINMTSGGLAIVLAGIPWLIEVNFAALSGKAWMGILYSGALSIALSYIIWNHALSKVGAVRTTAYQNFVPMFGVLFGFIILGERLSLWQYLGAIMVITGVVLTRIFKETWSASSQSR